MIYADNAATTRLSENAFKEMKKMFFDEYSNPSQPYVFARKSKKILSNARELIAECINANPEEIFFTSGGSESDNWAIKCYGESQKNRVIYSSNIEHHAVLNSCKETKNDYIQIPVDSYGIVHPDLLEKNLSNNEKNYSNFDKLVTIIMGNNEIGTIESIKDLARIAHKHNAYFHTDAVQCVGHISIDVKDLNVDMLSASAHKFNGPKGVGFLYIKKGTKIHPLINGGSQEKGYRAGTENVAAIIGMAIALKENCDNIEKNNEKLRKIESSFIQRMNENKIDYIRNGKENGLPGIINISIKNANGETLLHRLDLMGICISTGSACDSVNNQISHVIKAIGVPKEYAEGTIRISFGKDNSIDDAITIADSLSKILNS